MASNKYKSELIEELKLLAEAFIADAEALIEDYKEEHGRN
jgi:hypothetical protein